jgi:hypothetical protein
MIVGVDCEGMNVGGHFILAYARDGTGSKIANAISAEDKPKKLTAISKGKPANRLDDPTCSRNPNRWEPCGDYAVAVLKGKRIKICKLRDPRHPFKRGR